MLSTWEKIQNAMKLSLRADFLDQRNSPTTMVFKYDQHANNPEDV